MDSTATPAQTPRSRWRFSIRQLLFGMALIAVVLFLYREIPEMYRRQVLNDPLPLQVGNPKLMHIRRYPYMSSLREFVARVYLPPGKEYELCMGIAKEGEVYPAEPAVVQKLDEYYPYNSPLPEKDCRWQF